MELSRIVGALCAENAALLACGAGRRGLPSRVALAEAMHERRAALFPIKYAPTDLSAEDLR